jgi:integrase
MVYTLIETGMRRAAVRNLNLKDVDFKKRSVSAEEKGGHTHKYKISCEGLAAIKDYMEEERAQDFKRWRSPALFLSPATTPHGNGRLNPKVINTAWNEVCRLAGVEGHTPHDARHAMGKHLIKKPVTWPQFSASSGTPTRPIPCSTPGLRMRSWAMP